MTKRIANLIMANSYSAMCVVEEECAIETYFWISGEIHPFFPLEIKKKNSGSFVHHSLKWGIKIHFLKVACAATVVLLKIALKVLNSLTVFHLWHMTAILKRKISSYSVLFLIYIDTSLKFS